MPSFYHFNIQAGSTRAERIERWLLLEDRDFHVELKGGIDFKKQIKNPFFSPALLHEAPALPADTILEVSVLYKFHEPDFKFFLVPGNDPR